MNECADTAAKFISNITYLISGGLVWGDIISALDNHTGAFGLMLGALTFLTNLLFQLINYRVKRVKRVKRVNEDI